MSSHVRILGIAESLRRGSYNQAALRAAKLLVPENSEIDLFQLDDIPMDSTIVTRTNELRSLLEGLMRAGSLFLRQRSPESIQTFLFAIFRHVQYAAAA